MIQGQQIWGSPATNEWVYCKVTALAGNEVTAIREDNEEVPPCSLHKRSVFWCRSRADGVTLTFVLLEKAGIRTQELKLVDDRASPIYKLDGEVCACVCACASPAWLCPRRSCALPTERQCTCVPARSHACVQACAFTMHTCTCLCISVAVHLHTMRSGRLRARMPVQEVWEVDNLIQLGDVGSPAPFDRSEKSFINRLCTYL